MSDTPKIRNARYEDHYRLNEIFAHGNAVHNDMRPDLYRSVKVTVPKFKYSLAIIARDVFGHKPVSLQVADDHGIIVGAVYVESISRGKLSWSAFEKEAYLDNVVVIPGWRHRGIGTALLNAAQRWAKETGHEHMWGKILDVNEASLGLFKKAGFTKDSSIVGLHL